jgi:uncharacterized sulfatase
MVGLRSAGKEGIRAMTIRKMVAMAVVIVGSLALAGATASAGAAPKAKAPNIILIIADDMTWTDSGAYGNTDVPTPNIDRLAREGMMFRRAYQATAMCAVTRQQLYTGKDPRRSGAYPQHSWVDAGTRSVFHFLADLGYRVGLTGKTHVGPRASYPYEAVGDAADGGAGGGGDGDLPKVDFAAAEAFIRRNPGQPFFLVVASHNPHGPWTEGDAAQFDEARIKIPPYMVDTPQTRKQLKAYYGEITALDGEVGKVLELVEKAGLADDTLIMFTSEQGSSVPFAKWTLYDAGIHTQLIARWPGHIPAGVRTDAMVSYEDITPTFIDLAGGKANSDLDGSSFLSVLTRGEPDHRQYVHGIHTNFGIIGGEPYPIRSVRGERFKLIRNLMADRPFRNVLNNTARGSYMLTDWKKAAEAGDAFAAARIAAYNTRPPVELYDLQSDPFELRNLADDPKYAAERRILEVELDRWMAQQGDRGIPDELEAFSHINPAIVEWINKNYPDAARRPDGSKIP